MLQHQASRYVTLGLVDPKPSSTTTTLLYHHKWVALFHPPRMLIVDGGKAFAGELIPYCHNHGTYRHATPARQPTANGINERSHQAIESAIRIAVQSDVHSVRTVESLLADAQMAHNGAFHTAIRCSPYFFLFGLDPPLPRSLDLGSTSSEPERKSRQRMARIHYAAGLEALRASPDHEPEPHNVVEGDVVVKIFDKSEQKANRPHRLANTSLCYSPTCSLPGRVVRVVGEIADVYFYDGLSAKRIGVRRLRQYRAPTTKEQSLSLIGRGLWMKRKRYDPAALAQDLPLPLDGVNSADGPAVKRRMTSLLNAPATEATATS